MPPKKKSRVPTSLDSEAANATPSTPGPSSGTQLIGEPVYSDGWTDEQEITLFKAIAVYRWKPAGMHKHFRMLAISQLMRNHGVADTHTNPEGIWTKLNSLYNLEGLDEREDMDDDPDLPPSFTEFKLPDEDFGELMAMRRLNPEGTASPSHYHNQNRRRRFSESVKSAKGAGSTKGNSPSRDKTEGASGSDDESASRSSPMSQRSAPRKRGGTSRLSSVRGVSTPRGGRAVAARVGSTKKTPARRKSIAQQESSEEQGDGSGSEDEEGSEDEGEGSEEDEEGSRSPGSGSTNADEDVGSGEEEGDEDEDEEDGEDEEDEDEEEGDSPEVSTPRGSGGRRGGRSGGGGTGKTKTPAKRGGRKTVDSVRRSARKK